LRITKPVVLLGVDAPVIDGQGRGTVVTIEARDVVLRGFVIRNSGRSLDREDAGIAVYADRVTIADNRLENVLFGIYLRQADSCRILHNMIEGDPSLDTPRRGDLIRLWYSNDVLIEGNTTRHGRDVVIWFARGVVLRDNTMQFGRYGLHFMYSDSALVERNRMLRNSVGAYLMYSTRLTFRRNLLAYNRHASAIGVGLKDMDEVTVEENVLVDNQIGIFIDNSPRAIDAQIHYRGNVVAYNDIGVQALQDAPRSTFEDNSFLENYEQIDLVGGGRFSEANGTFWRRNYWSDYRGYDADRDGYGDVPYRAVALFDALTDRTPAFREFAFSPAVQALELAARAFPVIRPEPKLTDPTPRMRPRLPEGLPAVHQPMRPTLALAGLTLLLMGLWTMGRAHLRRLHG
ncbi:nitrous oxide reductase family maturation protein NosD, partial [Rhodothermus marinus]|uniref:nitrous oxide reductase family maturation protein NosD n=1 Tax=Rhodothermus marinus TaxID=29549 RepID=UPI0006D118CF